MSEQPQMRASTTQATLAALDDEAAQVRDAVLSHLNTAAFDEVRSAARVAWIDAERQMELNEALAAELGPEEYEAFWRRTGLAMAKTGALTKLAQGAMRIMGVDPSGLYKMIPRAGTHVTRNLGDCRVESQKGANCLDVIYSGLPAVVRRTDAYVRSTKGTLMVPLLFLERDGQVEMDISRLDEGMASFTVTWSAT